MTRHLYATCTNVSNIEEIAMRDNISSSSTSIELTCTSHSLSLGDVVNVDFGYSDDHTQVMTGGIVKRIQQHRPDYNYVITIYDRLILAMDYFFASDDPQLPLTYTQAAPETIVQDLLNKSGVTGGYHGTATGFLTGLLTNPFKVNLVTAWQTIENFNRIVGYMTWCDPTGDIYFNPRKPYIEAGDTASLALTTGNSGNLITVEYTQSDEQLRNKVVVYGKDGTNVKSTASASSPYLPAGYYKTIVLSHDIIDNQAMADATSALNLTMFNRLTESYTAKVEGKA
jgi:hypothetical protein